MQIAHCTGVQTVMSSVPLTTACVYPEDGKSFTDLCRKGKASEDRYTQVTSKQWNITRPRNRKKHFTIHDRDEPPAVKGKGHRA